MHDFMKSIGFSDIKNRRQLKKLLKEVEASCTDRRVFEEKGRDTYIEIYKSYSEDMGVMLRGSYDERHRFRTDYYFPFFRGTGITTEEPVVIEKYSEKEAYAGVCEDLKLGVSLIFYVINAAEILKKTRDGILLGDTTSVTLSGLASMGRILLPVNKDEMQLQRTRDASNNRQMMIAAAKEGDEEAIENLTLEDIDTYTSISRRIVSEDLFSIVDSYFMPYGIECDQYSIMGEILEFIEATNSETGEEIYILTLDVNELEFDVCINKKDVLGELKIGRRFKGVIWLQGYVNFD